jgi:hypothetical protein
MTGKSTLCKSGVTSYFLFLFLFSILPETHHKKIIIQTKETAKKDTAMNDSIFSKKAMKKLRSPDDMEKYLRVTNPGMWIILCACAALLIGLMAWAFFGSMFTTVSAMCTKLDGRMVSLIPPDDLSRISIGDETYIIGVAYEVSEFGPDPISKLEAIEMLGSEYLANTLMKDAWAYPVYFTSELEEDIPDEMLKLTNAIIITREMRPIETLFMNLHGARK